MNEVVMTRPQFSLPNDAWGKYGIIFGVEKHLSLHVNNRKKDALVLGEEPTDGSHETLIIAKATNYVNITKSKRKFVKFTLQYEQQCLLVH